MAASAWTPVPQSANGWTPVPEPKAPQKGFGESFADQSGLSALAHPVDTILGIPSGLKQMAKDSVQNVKQGIADYKKEGLSETTRRDFGRAVPIVGPALATAQGQYDAGNGAGAAGTIAGTVAGLAGPKAIKEVAPMVPGAIGRAAVATGDAAQDAGTGLMNKTVGTLKADFKRGANPARGYLETGNGPAISMRSLAEKANEAIGATGSKLDGAYKMADATGQFIPVADVANAVATPMKEAYNVATGVGAPKGLLEDLKYHASTFKKVLDQGEAQGGFTPSQVWQIKKDLAKATSWSDPTQVGLKSVTQQQVGALSGLLQKAVPETAELNQNYMDLLKMAGRAEERANTGSRPLTAHIYKAGMTAAGALAGGLEGNALLGAAAGAVLDSVPAKTTIATGLFRGGKALSALGDRLSPAESATVEGIPPNDLGGNGANYKNSNPQLPPPGPPELPASPNTTTRGYLPPSPIRQYLPPATNGAAVASPTYPPLNESAARMRVQPTRFNPQPTPTPPSGPLLVTPSGQVGFASEPKGLPTPSSSAPSKLSGRALWAQKGSEKLAAHGISAPDIEALAKTPKGKQLLIIASDLTPGSPAMKNLTKDIPALIGSTK